MKHSKKIPLWMWMKGDFDRGYGLTSYVRTLIYLFGLSSRDVGITLIVGVAYGFFAYSFGHFWRMKKLTDKENEMNNLLNPFQKEVRKHINGKRFK